MLAHVLATLADPRGVSVSGKSIFPGDLIAWCFASDECTHTEGGNTLANPRAKPGPRRIGIEVASVSSPKIVGRALSFAKRGETLDCLLRQ